MMNGANTKLDQERWDFLTSSFFRSDWTFGDVKLTSHEQLLCWGKRSLLFMLICLPNWFRKVRFSNRHTTYFRNLIVGSTTRSVLIVSAQWCHPQHVCSFCLGYFMHLDLLVLTWQIILFFAHTAGVIVAWQCYGGVWMSPCDPEWMSKLL